MGKKIQSLLSRKYIVICLIVILSGILTLVLYRISAASAQIKLNASSQSIVQGKTFTVDVNVSSDSPINLANAKITYNSTALSLRDINYSGSPLTTDGPEASNNNGSIKLNRFKIGGPYPSGNFKLATLTFQAISSTGNTSIDVIKSESLLYSDNAINVLTSVSGTTISFTKPPASTPIPNPTNPTPTPAPSTNSKPNTSSSNSSSQSSSQNSSTNNNTSPQNNSEGDNQQQGTDNNSISESDATPAVIGEQTPDTNIPAPGESFQSSNNGVFAQLSRIGLNLLPIFIILSVGIIAWFIYKKRKASSQSAPIIDSSNSSGPGIVFDGTRTKKTNNDDDIQ